MSVEQTNRIDAIGVEKMLGDVVLTISDHLEWGSADWRHLQLLRDKINTYLAFVESGELLESYPDAKDRNIVIDVVGKFPLNTEAQEFFRNATNAVSRAGMSLRFKLYSP